MAGNVHVVGQPPSGQGHVPSLDELHRRIAAAEQMVDVLRDLVLSLRHEHVTRRGLAFGDADLG